MTAAKADPRFAPTQHWLLLEGWVRKYGWTHGAELGLLKGRTFLHLLRSCPGLVLIGVDQWRQLEPSDEEGAEHYQKHNMEVCEMGVRAAAREFAGRAIIIKEDTVAAAEMIGEETLDFVFIDAGHTEAATRANIEAWAPKVKPAGWLTGHDWNWPSVARALDGLLPGWRAHEHNVWSIPKAEAFAPADAGFSRPYQ